MAPAAGTFQPDEAFARALDAADPLAPFRDRFHLPRRPDGRPLIYFCGHSLGLQPRDARRLVEQELTTWAELGVEGHFHSEAPWYSYHELFRDSAARLVGALPGEVVLMNSLTVNLHLMLATFYRPTPERHRILIAESAFPSDLYAVRSQLRHHGFDPDAALLVARPRPGEHALREEDMEEMLDRHGRQISVVLVDGVNFITGQYLDLPRLATAAHQQGCVFGADLAHAAGNVVLRLHDWDVDFAVWCSYKYLNGGPGAVAGCFVHERHGTNRDLPRLAGWWGTDPAARFGMANEFVPQAGAAGWQVSNPPILALAPLRASLALFDDAGMPALRAKSELLTGYFCYLLDRLCPEGVEVLTPRDPARRGSQISLRACDRPAKRVRTLAEHGVVCDFRQPDVIRVAPVPLYNTFHEVWTFIQLLAGQPV